MKFNIIINMINIIICILNIIIFIIIKSINIKNIIICIVIKPGLEVDPAKGPGPGFHGSTRKFFKK